MLFVGRLLSQGQGFHQMALPLTSQLRTLFVFTILLDNLIKITLKIAEVSQVEQRIGRQAQQQYYGNPLFQNIFGGSKEERLQLIVYA